MNEERQGKERQTVRAFQAQKRRERKNQRTYEGAKERRGKACEPDEKKNADEAEQIREPPCRKLSSKEKCRAAEKRKMHTGQRHYMAEPRIPERFRNGYFCVFPCTRKKREQKSAGNSPREHQFPEQEPGTRPFFKNARNKAIFTAFFYFRRCDSHGVRVSHTAKNIKAHAFLENHAADRQCRSVQPAGEKRLHDVGRNEKMNDSVRR